MPTAKLEEIIEKKVILKQEILLMKLYTKKGNRVIISYSWCSENKMNRGMYPIDIAWNSSPKSVKKKNLTEACGVLGIELESYRRIVNALNCWSMSPALDIFQ